ncbi:MAG: YtxH domain-containing protein [Vicinamibacteria bacterium]|nr:YtxH domain-containing protein [Vicinamibacteria bacterium]
MNEGRFYSTCLLGFLVGGLAGAGVALLIAPQSGRATRAAMKRSLHDTAASARGLKNRALRRGEGARDEAARRVTAAAAALAGDGTAV